jgi:ribose 5-phosphate isomerase A
MLENIEHAKKLAAERALQLVRPGMSVGLGTGSTVRYFIEGLKPLTGQLLCVPTSNRTKELADSLGLQTVEVYDQQLDIAVDGTDEFDTNLNLVKGHGGALLREKIVASFAKKFVVVADYTKKVNVLGMKGVPVEVLPFMWSATFSKLEKICDSATLRKQGNSPYVTDNGNYIIDLWYKNGIYEPHKLADHLDSIPGVLGHGLFLGLASTIIYSDGVEVYTLSGYQDRL